MDLRQISGKTEAVERSAAGKKQFHKDAGMKSFIICDYAQNIVSFFTILLYNVSYRRRLGRDISGMITAERRQSPGKTCRNDVLPEGRGPAGS